MTDEKKPTEDAPGFDAKKVEEDLTAQAKENLKNLEEKTTVDGTKKYTGGPIPR